MLEAPADNSLAVACGAARDWPENRGVFTDAQRSLVCWCNGPEDHCTLQVLQRDHDIYAALRNLCALHHGIQDHLEQNAQKRWVVSQDFGFVGTCPSNVGTSLVCEVRIRLATRGKDSSLMLGAVNHLCISLEQIKVGPPPFSIVLPPSCNLCRASLLPLLRLVGTPSCYLSQPQSVACCYPCLRSLACARLRALASSIAAALASSTPYPQVAHEDQDEDQPDDMEEWILTHKRVFGITEVSLSPSLSLLLSVFLVWSCAPAYPKLKLEPKLELCACIS